MKNCHFHNDHKYNHCIFYLDSKGYPDERIKIVPCDLNIVWVKQFQFAKYQMQLEHQMNVLDQYYYMLELKYKPK